MIYCIEVWKSSGHNDQWMIYCIEVWKSSGHNDQ